MRIFTVSFFGHRQLDNPFAVEQALEQIIRQLLAEKEYVEFPVERGRGSDTQKSEVGNASILEKCKKFANKQIYNPSKIRYNTVEFRSSVERPMMRGIPLIPFVQMG